MTKTEELNKLFPRSNKTMQELRKEYPWVVPNSLKGKGNARTVEIKCTLKGCAKTRRTRTMDVFQVKLCIKHQKEQDKKLTDIRRRKWRARDKERRRAVRAGEEP